MPMKSNSPTRLRAKIFGALSDPIRLEIVEFLREREKCVCEITPHIDKAQPVVSRHLKILKNSGLIKRRKKGTLHMYSVSDPVVWDLIDLLNPDVLAALKERIIKQVT